jgi:hypothetical protein
MKFEVVMVRMMMMMMMAFGPELEAVCSFENEISTRRYNPEDQHRQW